MGWYYFSYKANNGWVEINPKGSWFATFLGAANYALDLQEEYDSKIKFGKQNNKTEYMTP